jgi:hypothetical protein
MSKFVRRPSAAEVMRVDCVRSPNINRPKALAGLALAVMTGLVVLAGPQVAAADEIPSLDARVVAVKIPGASALAQVGTFLNVPPPGACANPIPTKFPTYIQPGFILDPKRLLVSSKSNFGAPRASGMGREGALLSIDPTGAYVLSVPPDFASSGTQAAALGGAVQMFSANSPSWRNKINNPSAFTQQYAGVGNPLGLSNNNAFGRVWPANSPFGLDHAGSSTILDPTGLPLLGAPNAEIGGVYFGDLTDRDKVTSTPQVITGALSKGAVGTALLGPSPDGTCKAVFAVVTADGAIVQEHTLKGLDGLAPPGTVRPILGSDGDAQIIRAHTFNGLPELALPGSVRAMLGDDGDREDEGVEPRFGVIMNPYTQAPVARQLFVSEPFYNTIAVINLVVVGTSPNQVFGLGSITRIASPGLNVPVDLTPVQRDADNVNWASNTTLDQGSDFYVANQGDNTIVRMQQTGAIVAIRRVTVKGHSLDDVRLNGIADSVDASTIFATFVDPDTGQGGVLAMPAF